MSIKVRGLVSVWSGQQVSSSRQVQESRVVCYAPASKPNATIATLPIRDLTWGKAATALVWQGVTELLLMLSG